MRENHLLSKGHLIEVGRGDLIGKYVGWTAPAIQKKFRQAEGGVLFIDEAYSLVDDRDGSYGDEAINTIVQEMENHRDNVVVIFADIRIKWRLSCRKIPASAPASHSTCRLTTTAQVNSVILPVFSPEKKDWSFPKMPAKNWNSCFPRHGNGTISKRKIRPQRNRKSPDGTGRPAA